MRLCLPCLLTALLTLSAAGHTQSAEAPDFRTYNIGVADGSNAAEVVRSVLGEGAKVFFDPATRQLMVLASSNQHEAAAGIVRKLNVPPRNVRIEVSFRGNGADRRRGASVAGRGAVVTRNGNGRSTLHLQPQVEDSLSTTSSSTRQQLLVSSGRQASIFVGENVPYMDWLVEYGRRYRYLEEHLVWQRVGAYLAIEPTVIGDGPLIRVRLTPELSGLVNNNPYRTRFANVATEVTVSDGVPFTLGGLASQNDFYSRFLVGTDQSGARQTLDIELTAYIVPATGSGP